MVYFMENHVWMDELGVPYFRKPPYHDIKIDLDLHVLTYMLYIELPGKL